MKQFRFLMFAFVLMGIAVSFSSCKDDPEADIVGTWNVDSILATNGSTDSDANGSGTFTFNSDNSGSRVYTFTNLGNTLTIDDEFTWDDSTEGELSLTNTTNMGVETWTRTVDTSSAQEMSFNTNVNGIVTRLSFVFSK